MRVNVIFLLAVLLFTACNPLRRVQRNQKADSTTVDQSEIRKVVTDILRESGAFSQTIIEYYPPGVMVMPPDQPEPYVPLPVDLQATATEPPSVTPPVIKRVVHTEIKTEAERTTTTDSLANNDIHTTIHSELSDKVVEKPPATVTAIKWIVVGLVALLLLILILKFSKIKIPFIK